MAGIMLQEKEKMQTMDVFAEKYAVDSKKGYLITKRVFDVTASVVALVILLIPMAIVALLIKLSSPGPAIYKQERLGKGGKPFVMYKFRSMRQDAEKNGPQWARTNDDRCTKIGRFIRVTHIDELPQLWNVVKGDMSIVGPRPEREYFYEEFVSYIPGFRERLLVKPGLTGLAQVHGGYDLTPEKKLELDLKYIQSASVKTDMKCLLKTVHVLIAREGVR